MIFNSIKKYIFMLLAIIFLSATVLSFYHFGIEQGFFSESLVCDLNIKNENMSKEELLKSLKTETISCKNVTFRIFSLSLATINTIISLILSIINIKIFLNYEKN
jgi:disulfide bond formation protein DsbB